MSIPQDWLETMVLARRTNDDTLLHLAMDSVVAIFTTDVEGSNIKSTAEDWVKLPLAKVVDNAVLGSSEHRSEEELHRILRLLLGSVAGCDASSELPHSPMDDERYTYTRSRKRRMTWEEHALTVESLREQEERLQVEEARLMTDRRILHRWRDRSQIAGSDACMASIDFRSGWGCECVGCKRYRDRQSELLATQRAAVRRKRCILEFAVVVDDVPAYRIGAR